MLKTPRSHRFRTLIICVMGIAEGIFALSRQFANSFCVGTTFGFRRSVRLAGEHSRNRTPKPIRIPINEKTISSPLYIPSRTHPVFLVRHGPCLLSPHHHTLYIPSLPVFVLCREWLVPLPLLRACIPLLRACPLCRLLLPFVIRRIAGVCTGRGARVVVEVQPLALDVLDDAHGEKISY